MRTTREIRHGHRASQQRQPLRFCVFVFLQNAKNIGLRGYTLLDY